MKGISLLVVGIGIIISSIFSMILEIVNPEIISDEYLDFLSIYNISLFLLFVGVFLMIIGGPKFITEQQKKSENIVFKKVNLFWQVIGSTVPGFDLFVMYRIKKLRLGIIVFSIQCALWVGLDFSGISNTFLDIDTIFVAIGYAVIVYIWSRRWNKQFSENIETDETK